MADSESSPRLLPVGQHLRRRGKDLERFLNLWKLTLIGAVTIVLVLGRIGRGLVLPEDAVIEVALGAMLVVGLAFQFYLAWAPWDHRVPLWVVMFDLVALTGLLLGCVAVDRAIVATNSQAAFFFYFFIVVSAGLRGELPVSRTVAFLVPTSYAVVVFGAVAWRHVQLPAQPDPVYGSFRWDLQAARLIILAVVTIVINYDVGLVAGDRAEARTDPLTGVYNRRFLEEFLHREITRSRRSRQPLSVLMLDLDGFKVFNDEHGHLAGDKVLATVAESLRDAVRTTDVVARYGGDEFVVVLPNTPGDAARRVARDLIRSVPPPVGLSVGIGCMAEGIQTTAELFAIADNALRSAKQSGVSMCVV
ncbi:MAG: GGDEF domain-containing protein [Acidobacteriia bacterium]|nr:GGDEF domain-containing protein [Terriglobia bacterium]